MGRENHTKFALLGLLSHESLSGYDIKKQVEYTLSNFWNIGYGQIYPELKKLEKSGLVTCSVDTPDSGPVKKIYSITDSGRGELVKWLKKDVSGESYRFEILLKLFFSGLIDKEFSLDKIKNFKERRGDKLSQYSIMMESLQGVLSVSEDHKYRYLTLLLGIHLEKAFISWSEEAKSFLDK